MKKFYVVWEIEVWTDTPEEAAREARRIHLDSDSTATVFDVTDSEGQTVRIDLLEERS